MSLNVTALADAITIGLGQSLPHSPEVLGFAQGIIDELKAGTAGFGGPNPSPYSISGVTGSSMAGRVKNAAPYPSVSSELSAFCGSIATQIQAGIVTYSGPPGGPYALGGTISGVSGSAIASGAGFPSVTSQLSGMCNAIANHTVSNAQVVSGVIS